MSDWYWIVYLAVALFMTGFWIQKEKSFDWAWFLVGLFWPGILLLEMGAWVARKIEEE